VALYQDNRDYKFLKRLFRNEFIFEDKKGRPRRSDSMLTYMLEQKMIKDISTSKARRCIEIRGRVPHR